MNTCDIILAVIGLAAFIPFVLIVIGGSIMIATELIHDIKQMWQAMSNTNTKNHTK